MSPRNSYLCDTLPQAKRAQTTTKHPSPSHTSVPSQSEQPSTSDNPKMIPLEDVHPTPALPQRKLCPRHKRMADEGTNLKLQQVRDYQIANLYTSLTHIPPGFGCSPFAGAGGRQRCLGKLLGLAASSARLDSPGSTDHVLLLSTLSTRRPALVHHSDRPLLYSSPRSLPPSPHIPRRHFALSGCSSKQEVETPRRR